MDTTPEATPDRPPRRKQEHTPDRLHPLLWADWTELPLESLSFDMVDTRMIAPYRVMLRFFSQGHYIWPNRADQGDALAGRHILPDDILIFDRDRTAPEHDAIMLVAEGRGWVPRVCAVLGEGWVEFRAAAPGYPTLSGEREIVGTLAAVVRATDGKAAG